MNKDVIKLAIDALEFYADFDPDRERGLYGEYEALGVFLLDEGTKAKEALEQLCALQSQPAANGLGKVREFSRQMNDAISDVGAICNLGTIPAIWGDLVAILDQKAAHNPTTTTPASWKLVPVEPTEEMIEAAHDAVTKATVSEVYEDEDFYRLMYQAMLSAAPDLRGG